MAIVEFFGTVINTNLVEDGTVSSVDGKHSVTLNFVSGKSITISDMGGQRKNALLKLLNENSALILNKVEASDETSEDTASTEVETPAVATTTKTSEAKKPAFVG